MSNETKVWKKASEIYADISELSPKKALAHVYGIENITLDVREAIITLINAGSQASQYYRDNISQGFNLDINTTQSFSSGQQLDEYELLEEIGHGGMSQVFKAKRINTEAQTHVAIKIFAPKDNSNELLNHFLNEQKILAGLSHPNIVKMLHSGRTEDNVTYLVMELIDDAQPLDIYCQTNQFSIKQKIRYVAQCAQTLSYSHANLIIHRDLKPDNILIDSNKELKIVDFGIAKLINNDLSGNKTTIMALTPSYAAPEQINSGPISIKTDIFSLAVVALDLLTKENPLPKDRLIKSCTNDEHHIDALLKRLKIDIDLKNILNKALEQEPNKRYSSMQSFADDLNNYLTSNPVNATAQSFFYRTQKFAKRRSALFATMVSFVAFMFIGSIVGYKQYQQIKIEAQKAQIVKQFMLDSFEVTDPDKAQGVDISTKDLLKIASEKLKNNHKLDNEIKFELLQTLGLAYGKLGSYNQAIKSLKESLSIKNNDSKSLSYLAQFLFNSQKNQELNTLLETVKPENLTDVKDQSRILRIQANRFLNHSKFDETHEVLAQLNDLNTNQKYPQLYVLTQRLLAKTYYYEYKLEKSIAILTKLLEDKNLKIKSTIDMGIRSDLATLYNDSGETDLSIKQWHRIISQQKAILGDKHPELVSSLVGLSTAFMYKGDIKKSNELIDEAYEISINLFGENNLTTASVLNTRAILLRHNGEIEEAITLIYKVINIYEQQETINYQDTNIIKMNLAQLLNAENKNNQAFELAEKVYQYQLKNLGETHADTMFSQQILVRILIDLNKPKEAVSLAKNAVANAQKLLEKGNKSSDFVGSYYTLALAYQADKQYPLAIKNFLYIVDNKLLDENGLNLAITISSIAKLYAEMNDFDNAKKYYQDTIKRYTKIYSSNHLKTLNLQATYAALLKSNMHLEESNDLLLNIENIIKENNIEDKVLLTQIQNLY